MTNKPLKRKESAIDFVFLLFLLWNQPGIFKKKKKKKEDPNPHCSSGAAVQQMNIGSCWATSLCAFVCAPLSVKQGTAHKQKRLYLNKKINWINNKSNRCDRVWTAWSEQRVNICMFWFTLDNVNQNMCVRKFVFAWEFFSCGTHIMGGGVGVCVWLLCPEMTDERFALIFEQSALASLSAEAMLFLRVREAEEECIARVTPIAKKLQVGEYCRFRAPGISAVWLMSLWDLPGDRKENYSVHSTPSGYCLVTTLNWILL